MLADDHMTIRNSSANFQVTDVTVKLIVIAAKTNLLTGIGISAEQ